MLPDGIDNVHQASHKTAHGLLVGFAFSTFLGQVGLCQGIAAFLGKRDHIEDGLEFSISLSMDAMA